MSRVGPLLPTWALQQVVSYLGYTGHRANADATAAFDPQPTCVAQDFCSANCRLNSTLPRRRNCQMETQ